MLNVLDKLAMLRQFIKNIQYKYNPE